MVLAQSIKELQATEVVTYKMYELWYSSGRDHRYTVKKHLKYANGTEHTDVLVCPVTREVAEMVWDQAVVNRKVVNK